MGRERAGASAAASERLVLAEVAQRSDHRRQWPGNQHPKDRLLAKPVIDPWDGASEAKQPCHGSISLP